MVHAGKEPTATLQGQVAAASESQSLPQSVPKSPLPNVGKAQYYFPVAIVQIITDLVV